MDQESFDDWMDSLPPSLRNKALQAGEPKAKKIRTHRVYNPLAWILVVLAFTWATPWIVAGALLAVTGFLAPIGLILMTIGAAPAVAAVKYLIGA